MKNSSVSSNFMVSITLGRIGVFRNTALLVWVLSLLLRTTLALDQPSIIVFPLEGSSDDGALSWLGEGIAASVSNQLKGAQLRPMDRSERIKLVESLDLPPDATLSRGSMIRVAQRAEADLVVFGTYSGTEKNLRIAVRVLNIKALKLSGEMVANGPLSALPEMENELAWLILRNNGYEKTSSRDKFQERKRRIPNLAYSDYIESLTSSSERLQINLLLSALQTYRDFPEAQFQLAQIYFHHGDCVSALPHLELARRESSTSKELDFMRGTCFVLQDESARAIQAFSQLFQVSRPFQALNNIGVAYLRKGDWAQAVNVLLEAKSSAQADPTVSLNLAIARHLQGNDPAARIIAEEACKSDPTNGRLRFLLGFLQKAQGEDEKSAATLAKAKSLGADVQKLQSEDPKEWAGVLLSIQSR
jgi:tetratricopeptide (TPR) repeat protein